MRIELEIGGIKINHRMELLNHEEHPIPVLHAASNVAGGMSGVSCDLWLP